MSNTLVVQKERPTATVTVLVDPALRRLLEDEARRNERSLGAEVRHLLRRHLERAEKEEAHDVSQEG